MSNTNAGDIALGHFSEGFNCAESVLQGVTKASGIENECVPRVASGFGGGVAGCGDICGALSGAIMAMGLKCGRERGDDVDAKNALYEMIRELYDNFKRAFGTISCLDLTGCDLRTPEGAARAKDLNLHGDFCRKFVEFAANEAGRILGQNTK